MSNGSPSRTPASIPERQASGGQQSIHTRPTQLSIPLPNEAVPPDTAPPAYTPRATVEDRALPAHHFAHSTFSIFDSQDNEINYIRLATLWQYASAIPTSVFEIRDEAYDCFLEELPLWPVARTDGATLPSDGSVERRTEPSDLWYVHTNPRNRARSWRKVDSFLNFEVALVEQWFSIVRNEQSNNPFEFCFWVTRVDKRPEVGADAVRCFAPA